MLCPGCGDAFAFTDHGAPLLVPFHSAAYALIKCPDPSALGNFVRARAAIRSTN